jgi:hypothetical protein
VHTPCARRCPACNLRARTPKSPLPPGKNATVSVGHGADLWDPRREATKRHPGRNFIRCSTLWFLSCARGSPGSGPGSYLGEYFRYRDPLTTGSCQPAGIHQDRQEVYLLAWRYHSSTALGSLWTKYGSIPAGVVPQHVDRGGGLHPGGHATDPALAELPVFFAGIERDPERGDYRPHHPQRPARHHCAAGVGAPSRPEKIGTWGPQSVRCPACISAPEYRRAPSLQEKTGSWGSQSVLPTKSASNEKRIPLLDLQLRTLSHNFGRFKTTFVPLPGCLGARLLFEPAASSTPGVEPDRGRASGREPGRLSASGRVAPVARRTGKGRPPHRRPGRNPL